MRSTKREEFSFDRDFGDEGYSVHAEGYIEAFFPGQKHNRNGDPGDPPEGGETVFTLIEVYDGDGNLMTSRKGLSDTWLEKQAADEVDK